MNHVDRGAIVIGILLAVAGVYFLLEALGVVTLSAAVMWPILVIGFGVGIAFGGRKTKKPPADDTTLD